MIDQHGIKSARYTFPDNSIDVISTMMDNSTRFRRSDDDEGNGGMLAYIAQGGTIAPYAAPAATSRDVNVERDRRISDGFVFGGNEYQTDQGSRENISGAQGLSLGAMIADPAGSLGLRWTNPDKDFAWTDSSNNEIAMTAAECQAFCHSAMQYKTDLIKSARVVKDSNPIPENYADDIHWPSRTLD
jgi:hypothetical protein